jgi:putative membrane protein insertion efficiency factor
MRSAARGMIRAYQLVISPHLGKRCRFYPSCSQYAYEAYSRYGVLRASALTATRLCRCNPFNAGGYDPVPTVGKAPKQ